jgi:hypothetical protein
MGASCRSCLRRPESGVVTGMDVATAVRDDMAVWSGYAAVPVLARLEGRFDDAGGAEVETSRA